MGYPETFEGFAVSDQKKWSEVKKIDWSPKPFEDHDVDIKIDACGVCGSDVHTVMGAWSPPSVSPIVVGHEVVGTVLKVGKAVTTVTPGDRVGVGAQVWACLEKSCKMCASGNETYCPRRVHTYNSRYEDGSVAQGGYASHMRCHEVFAFPIPENLSTVEVAPLFCAGLTVYSPLKSNGAGPGVKVGVVGIGGLGHLAIKFAKALGAEVFAISRGDKKKADCLALGADHYVDAKKEKWYLDPLVEFELDMIVCTANSSEGFDLNGYMRTLKLGGKWVSLGLPEKPFPVSPFTFMQNGAFLGSSHLGSRREALEMLEIASKHNVTAMVEEVPIGVDGVKEALERCHAGDVKYRFVLTDFEKQFGK